MLDWIIQFDKELLYAINGLHNSFLDAIMTFASHKYAGIPIYIFLIFIIFYKRNIKISLLMIAAVLVTFALCDSLSVALFKDQFQRLRPCHQPDVQNLIRILEYKGGLYGFISSHAANYFGLAAISSLILKNRYYTLFIYSWATLVSYSRIYVGKHYPADVVVGAIFGILVGFIIFLIYKFIVRCINKRGGESN